MSVKDIVKKLHPLERKLLPFLKKSVSFDDLVKKSGMKDIEVMRALQWLENKSVLKIDSNELEIVDLDKNGSEYKKSGLPEKRFLKALDKPLTLDELAKKSKLDRNEIGISIGKLRKENLIETKKEKELFVNITKQGEKYLKEESDEEKFLSKKFPIESSILSSSEQNVLKNLQSRKQIVKIDKVTERQIKLTKLGESLTKEKISASDVIDKVDSKLLKSGSWKNKDFREYDVEINVPSISGGKRHFTNQVVEYIKSIWLELGFKEMTGNMVQTSFWDLDALFVPQDHPAREMQDTFYLKNPRSGKLPTEFTDKIKKTHEDGGDSGSTGWKSKWDSKKAAENLLRTHTTALSAQTIKNLKKEDLPAKFFAVGKCFRNETLDWKHLFEFYQVEGIVIDPDANFGNLVGYLKEFFGKMGFPDVRIRPAHFPYTEPSAEVDVWHPVKKQWVELGGSGIFRPEVTKPLMGFEVPVLAWGLGLGRMISEYWDITDIRDLYKNDLKQLRELKVWMK